MTTSKSLPLIEADGASLVSRVWVQVAALVLLCGLAILGFLGYRAYTSDPPIAGQVLTPAGQLVYTGADVIAGQQLFLRKGLMEYGSIFGHGAYLGPDSPPTTCTARRRSPLGSTVATPPVPLGPR
ncbi:MAG: hypothetical protein H0V92_07470 [Pseudonocardiales bacterium]|nr:hypothetical protein [Pseudonocardiales bacterium]